MTDLQAETPAELRELATYLRTLAERIEAKAAHDEAKAAAIPTGAPANPVKVPPAEPEPTPALAQVIPLANGRLTVPPRHARTVVSAYAPADKGAWRCAACARERTQRERYLLMPDDVFLCAACASSVTLKGL